MAAFDAAMGSYVIVAEIGKRLPRQNSLYFADRASFSCGATSRERMLVLIDVDIPLENVVPPA